MPNATLTIPPGPHELVIRLDPEKVYRRNVPDTGHVDYLLERLLRGGETSAQALAWLGLDEVYCLDESGNKVWHYDFAGEEVREVSE